MITVLASIAVGILGVVYMKRRDIISADRPVLDDIVSDIATFHPVVREIENAAKATNPDVTRLAADLSVCWESLESAASQMARLSSLRYDGLGPLAHRLRDACTSTAEDRSFLRDLAEGHSLESASRLEVAIPWPDLYSDSLVYRALASIYRREGPLTPRRRAWWRIASHRDKTDFQIAAPIRHRVRKLRKRRSAGITSIEPVREIMRERPEFDDLPDHDMNRIAYRVLRPDE